MMRTSGWRLPWLCAGLALCALAPAVLAKARPAPDPASLQLLWPPPPDTARVRYVDELRGPKDLGRSGTTLKRLARSIAGARRGADAVLARPTDVYAADSTRVFVTDASTGKLHVFDYTTRAVRTLGATGAGTLSRPLGLGGDGRGQVFVTDPGSRRVAVFTLEGGFVRAMGGPGILLNPVDVAVDPRSGEAWVVDSYLHQVVVFDGTGQVVRRIGKQEKPVPLRASAPALPALISGHGKADITSETHGPGKRSSDVLENRGGGPGEFLYPISIARSPDGRFHVTDGLNGRVQSFDATGRFLSEFGHLGDTPGSLPRPKGIACDSDGHLHVVDAAFNNIQLFDSAGQLLLAVGSLGQEPGRFWLPLGMHIDGDDRVYVADRYNGRVQILQYHPASTTAQRGPSVERGHSGASQGGHR